MSKQEINFVQFLTKFLQKLIFNKSLCIAIDILLAGKLVDLLKLFGVPTEEPQVMGAFSFCNISPHSSTLSQPANNLEYKIYIILLSLIFNKISH